MKKCLCYIPSIIHLFHFFTYAQPCDIETQIKSHLEIEFELMAQADCLNNYEMDYEIEDAVY